MLQPDYDDIEDDYVSSMRPSAVIKDDKKSKKVDNKKYGQYLVWMIKIKTKLYLI